MALSRSQQRCDTSSQTHPRAEIVDSFVKTHGVTLLAAARRLSQSAADADDAYQRTLEVLLTKGPGAEDTNLLAWSLTVLKNEVLMERRRSAHLIPNADEYLAAQSSGGDLATHVEEAESDAKKLEVLKQVEPNQIRCLLLKADGLSYNEIESVTGYSYAKVNRLLSEGRSAMRDRLQRIDSGAECRRFTGLLSLLADGEMRVSDRADLEDHLQNCGYCQATLRDYVTAPSRAAELVPVGFISADQGFASEGWFHRAADSIQSAFLTVQERLVGHAASIQVAGEASVAKKVTAVVAISGSLVAGGAAIERQVARQSDPVRNTPAPPSAIGGGEGVDEGRAPAQEETSEKDLPEAESNAPVEARASEVDGPSVDDGDDGDDGSDPVVDEVPQGVSTQSEDDFLPPESTSDTTPSSDSATGLAP